MELMRGVCWNLNCVPRSDGTLLFSTGRVQLTLEKNKRLPSKSWRCGGGPPGGPYMSIRQNRPALSTL